MNLTLRHLRLAIAVLCLVVAVPDLAAAEALVVRNLVVADGAMSGDLVNTSHRLVSDVRLFVRHTWLGTSEGSRDQEGLGRVAYSTVHTSIPPGAIRSFRVNVDPPLPARSDGRFETEVEVVGFRQGGD